MFLNHLKDGEVVLKQLTIRNESTDEMLKMMKKEQVLSNTLGVWT